MSDSTIGELPQSSALAEASPESLNDLLSRLPQNDSDLSKQVEALRAQRERWMKAEAAGGRAKPKAAAKAGGKPSLDPLGVTSNPEELGF